VGPKFHPCTPGPAPKGRNPLNGSKSHANLHLHEAISCRGAIATPVQTQFKMRLSAIMASSHGTSIAFEPNHDAGRNVLQVYTEIKARINPVSYLCCCVCDYWKLRPTTNLMQPETSQVAGFYGSIVPYSNLRAMSLWHQRETPSRADLYADTTAYQTSFCVRPVSGLELCSSSCLGHYWKSDSYLCTRGVGTRWGNWIARHKMRNK
jgi:hypothetical protein